MMHDLRKTSGMALFLILAALVPAWLVSDKVPPMPANNVFWLALCMAALGIAVAAVIWSTSIQSKEPTIWDSLIGLSIATGLGMIAISMLVGLATMGSGYSGEAVAVSVIAYLGGLTINWLATLLFAGNEGWLDAHQQSSVTDIEQRRRGA